MEPITLAYIALGATGVLSIVVLVMALVARKRKREINRLKAANQLTVQQKNDMIFWLIGYAVTEANFLGLPGTEYLGRRVEEDFIVLTIGVPEKLYNQRNNAKNKCERMLFEIHSFMQLKHHFRIEFVKLPIASVIPIVQTADKEESDGKQEESQSEHQSNVLRWRDGTHR